MKRASIKLFRTCWPKIDTGWISTATATKKTSSSTYSVYKMVFDSPIWECVTQYRYKWTYF